jgi:PAS domain S-box-containing protein
MAQTHTWPTFSIRRWAWLAAGYVAAYGLWLAIRPDNFTLQLILSHLAPVVPGILAAQAALARYRQPTLPIYWRRAWMFWGLALWLWVVGGALWVAYWLFNGQLAPVPSLADLPYMAGHFLALAGLLSFPFFPATGFGRLRVALDALTVAGVTFALGWLLLLQPLVVSEDIALTEKLWPAAYLVLDVMLFAVLNIRAVAFAPAAARPLFTMVGAALFVLALGDIAYTYLGLRGQADLNALFDVARLIGFSGVGLAAGLQAEGRLAQAWPGPRWLRRLQASLPLALGLALAFFTVFNWQASGDLRPFAVWATILISLVVLARQGVAAGEVELRQYMQLVESAADPAFVCDERGKLLLANPALAAAIGHANVEALSGQTLPALITPATLPRELHQTRAFARPVLEDGWSGEVRLRRTNGSEFPVYLALRPVPDDSGARLVLAGTAHDLSVQKRQQEALITARQALQDLNADLELRVAEKTAELARQNEELKTLDQLKSDFVTMVSHELRAPLTNISGGMELTLARTELPTRARETLATVQAEIKRLSRFVETILDLSALDAGRLPLTLAPLDLSATLEALRAQWVALPAGSRVQIQAAQPLPAVLADERALTSVFFHLVDNALKYAPGGEVTVSVEPRGANVWAAVSDSGPGIPPEQRTAIFERFQRLNSADAQMVYGHGVGLYMVRRLLNAMHSEITVDDAPGGGARFAFELPITLEET